MNKDLLKITIVLASMPVWLPFAKALWEEFRDAMRGDGGFDGPTPSPAKRKEIEAEIALEEPRIVDEPLAVHRAKQSAKFRSGGTPKSGATGGRADGPKGGASKGSQKAFRG
ncbi:MAG: hypothetical protein ACI835_004689 [Planctomycetota bacterium]|jgi:hypothetical protein